MKNRTLAAAEALAVVGSILLVIWIIQPLERPGLDRAALALVALFLAASPWLHHDSPERLGLRFHTFLRAFARLLPASLAAAGAAIGAGYYLVTIDPPVDPARTFAIYLSWAGLQQYALQSVVLLRLADAGLGKSAPLVAAVLFALVHAPNPGLMALTFLGALLWCSTFRRHPNLLALALSHAALAIVIVSTLPLEVTGGLRIGPAYWRRP